MKNGFRYAPLALLMLLTVCNREVRTQNKAKVVQDTNGKHVQVSIKEILDPVGGPILARLYLIEGDGNTRLIEKAVNDVDSTSQPGFTRFSMPLPSGPLETSGYQVIVLEFPTLANGVKAIRSYSLNASGLLSIRLDRSVPRCSTSGGISLVLMAPLFNEHQWQSVLTWLGAFKRDPEKLADLSVRTGTVVTAYHVQKFVLSDEDAKHISENKGGMWVCLKTEETLPDQDFQVQAQFHGAMPAELKEPIRSDELSALVAPPVPKLADDNGTPGQRKVEQNLDLGLSYTNERDIKSGTRSEKGIIDLRLAPWLNVWGPPPTIGKWLRYSTPFYVDAEASTGKIDDDTLSLNRTILGFKEQFRYYPSAKSLTLHRIDVAFEHRSDRDFKQNEYDLKVEYAPRIDSLFKPIYLNWKKTKNPLDPDGDLIRETGDFGFTFLPKIGGEIGHTYKRRRPAAAIETSPTVRRIFFGGELTINPTRFAAVTLSDTFFVRGEAPSDRGHNHFKASVELPLSRPFGGGVHSLVISYENGDEPPFAKKHNVNAFKIGYRIRAEGWLGSH